MTPEERKHIVTWGGGYAVSLIVSTAVFMYIALIGGNPYHPGPGQSFDSKGVERTEFHRGEWVYIRRSVCIDKDIFADQSPSLYDLNRHSYISLSGTATVAKKGCAIRSQAVEIPTSIPLGDYEYRNIARFQNNLVGRDESNSYPPVRIKVIE